MPKHNPKLDKPDNDKKKKPSSYSEEEYYDSSINYSRVLMGVIFVVVLMVIVVLVANVYDEEDNVRIVQKYDLVLMDYAIYTYEQYDDNLEPTIRYTNKWVNACQRYDENCKCKYGVNATKKFCEESLVKGLYYKLLGKQVSSNTHTIFIEDCKDHDLDGYDDFSDEEALSYGHPEDVLYDKEIVITFRVLDIKKQGS